MENQDNTYTISLVPINVDNADERAKPFLEAAMKQTGITPNIYENM